MAVTTARHYSKEEVREQEERAFVMFAERRSIKDISRELDIAPITAQKRVNNAIKRQYTPRREEAVKRDMVLIDRIIRNAISIMDNTVDAEVSLKAANVALNALKRRAAMLGYDAPQQILIDGQVELIAKVDPRILEARQLLAVESTRADKPALPTAE
jgi:hypothetical protein